MDFSYPERKEDVSRLKAGKLLIAEPFLADPNFSRTVIFICEYGEDGSVGFVLNKPTEYKLNELLPEIAAQDLDVNQGGPVQLDTLHMLHKMPVQLGGNEVLPGVYWGGSYEALQDVLTGNQYKQEDLKLFLGYSGWSPGQLEQEVKDGSWIITDLSEKILFNTAPGEVWKSAIRLLDRKYHVLANMPVNPQLN